jgi:hypothetical protein
MAGWGLLKAYPWAFKMPMPNKANMENICSGLEKPITRDERL